MLRKNKMTVKEIEKLIKDGEKINIEFKELQTVNKIIQKNLLKYKNV